MRKIVGLEFLKSLCRRGEKPIGNFFRLALEFNDDKTKLSVSRAGAVVAQ